VSLSVFDAKYELGTLRAMAARKYLMVDAETPERSRNVENDPWPGPLFDGDNALPPQYKVVSEAHETLESETYVDAGGAKTPTTLYITGSKVYTRLGEKPWTSKSWKPNSEKVHQEDKDEFRKYQKTWLEEFMKNQGLPHINFSFTDIAQLEVELEEPENAAAKDEFERWEEAWCGRWDKYDAAADRRSPEQAARDIEHQDNLPSVRFLLSRISRAFVHLLLSAPNEPISDKVPPIADPYDIHSPLPRTWHIDPHGRTLAMVGKDGGWEEAERYANVLRRQGKGDGITVVGVPTTAPTFMVGEHRYCVLDLSDPSHSAFWYHEFNVLARKVWSFEVRKQIARNLEVSHTRQVCYPLLRGGCASLIGTQKVLLVLSFALGLVLL
jgi:hypothetical protein